MVEAYYDPLNANWVDSNDDHTVNLLYATQLALVESPDPGGVNDDIILEATLTSTGGGTPTSGTVDFYVDSVLQASGIGLTGGVASFNTGMWAAGTHTTQAIYSGGGNFDGCSNSGSFSVS